MAHIHLQTHIYTILRARSQYFWRSLPLERTCYNHYHSLWYLCGRCVYSHVPKHLQILREDNLKWCILRICGINTYIPLTDVKQMMEYEIYNRFTSHGMHTTQLWYTEGIQHSTAQAELTRIRREIYLPRNYLIF